MPEVELKPLATLSGGGGGGGPVTSELITDASPTGKDILTGDALAGRIALEAAAAADLVALAEAIENLDWGNLDGKPAVIAAGADAAAARDAIGAGTSSLTIGTTASTAKAGNWKPAAADISDASTDGREVLKGSSKAAIRDYLQVPATADVASAAAAAAASAVPGEVSDSAIKNSSSSTLGLMSGRRYDAAYLARKIAYGEPWIVEYDGTNWPDISTVPLEIRNATSVRIIWDSTEHLDAPQPPQMRERDRWRELVED